MTELDRLKQALSAYADHYYQQQIDSVPEHLPYFEAEYAKYQQVWDANKLNDKTEQTLMFNILKDKETYLTSSKVRVCPGDSLYRVLVSAAGFKVEVQPAARAWWTDIRHNIPALTVQSAYKLMLLCENFNTDRVILETLVVGNNNGTKPGFAFRQNLINFSNGFFIFSDTWNECSNFCATPTEALNTLTSFLLVEWRQAVDNIANIVM